TPLLSLPATAAFAGVTAPTAPTPVGPATSTTTVTPAPAAAASASAVQITGIVTVGGTSTGANGSGGNANADALTLLGKQISGGSTSDPSKPAKGQLIATPANGFADAEVAPYSAAVTHTGNTWSSDADASLAHAGLDGLLQVWVLHSHSHSDYTT